MSVIRISSRYAKSLLDLAVERNELEAIYQDILLFQKMVSNRDLYLLLKSPIISSSKKIGIFKILFEGKISKMTMAFFNIAVTKGREKFLPEIAIEFIRQYKEFKNISTVYLTAAEAFSPEQMEEIRKKLLATSITKDSIEWVTKVDPEIIGGYIVKIGDNQYDASVKSRLAQLKKEFLDNEYIKTI